MGTPSVIDLNALKAPISDDAPSGSNIGEDGCMYDLRSLADTARSAEKKWDLLPYGPDGKQTVPEGTQAPPVPNWAPVLKASIEILLKKSKDLSVCAILIESLARLHGFAGIRDGAILVRELAETYWGTLFPMFDQDEFEALEQHPTVAAISGLNGTSILPFAIERIPFLRTSPIGPLTSIDYLDAFDKQLRIKRDQFESAVKAVAEPIYDNLLDDVQGALASYSQMAELLNAKCEESHEAPGPASSSIESTLEDVIRRVRHISGKSAGTSAADGTDVSTTADGTAASNIMAKSSTIVSSGPLQSRDEAYEMLRKVADYFSRAEPHSPVSTALKRIVTWRNLSFPQLMKELVDNTDARRDLYRLTGFKEEES